MKKTYIKVIKNLKVSLFIFVLTFSLVSCGSLSSIFNAFTNQDIEEIIALVEQSGCQIIDVDQLRGLVSEVGDDVLEVFGISEEQVNAEIDAYEADNRSSLCIFTAELSGSTTHRAFFFTSDNDHNTQTWNASEIEITETLSDGSTNTYPADSVTPFSDFASDASNTTFSFSSVMDYSGSMSSSDLSSLESGLTFLYQNIPDNFRSEVIKFSSSVQVVQTYTDNEEGLVSAVTGGDISRGATALYDGMYQGLEDTALETSKVRFIISFTDGLENSSTRSRSDVVTLAQTNEIPIINIGMGTIVDLAVLLEISNQTGGFFFYASNNTVLDAVFTQLSNYLNNTSVVTWTSADTGSVSSISIAAGDAFTGSFTP